jgi:hypothetical protein
MEEEIVTPETPNEPVIEETVETPPTETSGESTETPEVDVEQLQATNRKLYERAKKAEADLKVLRDSKVAPVGKSASSQPSVEETVLLAQGMPEELVNELKVVAQVRKVSLIKAQNDPIFVAVKDKFEKDLKKKDASLPASRGSGSVKPKKTFTTPGLTRDEHKQMFQESR